ncbi:hypothetical protein CYMTET_22145 [Cymbomonas tetramitiformis]|uniref:Uncharacterized protein n=1 Tax=Cymbomonas tetramitiformis TaxID=36881 RepID=A0AAE0G0I4_9CHLO|nr:hypothetical protein CYMTET_22145 [Cymbomonas tetramitiformis]
MATTAPALPREGDKRFSSTVERKPTNLAIGLLSTSAPEDLYGNHEAPIHKERQATQDEVWDKAERRAARGDGRASWRQDAAKPSPRKKAPIETGSGANMLSWPFKAQTGLPDVELEKRQLVKAPQPSPRSPRMHLGPLPTKDSSSAKRDDAALSFRLQAMNKKVNKLVTQYETGNSQRLLRTEEHVGACKYFHAQQAGLPPPEVPFALEVPASLAELSNAAQPSTASHSEPSAAALPAPPPSNPASAAPRGGRKLLLPPNVLPHSLETKAPENGSLTARGRLESDGLRQELGTSAEDVKLKKDPQHLYGASPLISALERSSRVPLEPELEWVRRLVQFTDENPLFLEDRFSSQCERTSTGRWETTVFPAALPVRREDTMLLSKWLASMLKTLSLEHKEALPRKATIQEGDAETIANVQQLSHSALWLYQVAYQELQKQVSLHCQERASLMGKLWESLHVLTELNARLRYETELCKAHDGVAALHTEKELMEAELLRKLQDAARAHRDLMEDHQRMERGRQQMALELVRVNAHRALQTTRIGSKARMNTQNTLSDRSGNNRELQEQLLAEMTLRTKLEKEVEKLNKHTADLVRQRDNHERQAAAEGQRRIIVEDRMKVMEKNMTDMTDEMAKQSEEIKQLSATRLTLTAKLRDATVEINEKNVVMAEFNTKYAAATDEIATLREETNSAVRDLENVKEALASADNDKNKLVQELSHKTQAKVAVDLLYAKLKNSNDNLTTGIREAKEAKEAVEKEYARAKAEFEEKMLENMRKTRDADELLEQTRHSLERQKLELNNVNTEMAERVALLRQLEICVEAPSAGVAQVPIPGVGNVRHAENAEWAQYGAQGKGQKSIVAAMTKIADMQTALEESLHQRELSRMKSIGEERENQRLEQKVYEEKVRNERLVREMEVNGNEMKKRSTEAATLRRRVNELDTKLRDSAHQLTMEQSQTAKLKKQLEVMSSLMQEKNKLQAALADAKGNLTSHGTDMEMMLHKITELQEDLEAANVAMQKHKLRMEKLQEHVGSLEQENTHQKGIIAERAAQIDGLMDEAKQQKESAEANAGDAEQQIGELNDRISHCRKLNKIYKKHLQKANNTVLVSKFLLKGLSQEPEMDTTPVDVPPGDQEALDDYLAQRHEEFLSAKLKAMKAGTVLTELEVGEEEAGKEVEDEIPPPIYGMPAALVRLQTCALLATIRNLRTQLNSRIVHEMRLVAWTQDALVDVGSKFVDEMDCEKRLLREQRAMVHRMRQELATMRDDHAANSELTQNFMDQLADKEEKFNTRKDVSTLSNDTHGMLSLSAFVRDLPVEVPTGNNIADRKKVVRTIVQIYCKRLEKTMTAFSEGEREITDSPYEPMMTCFVQIFGGQAGAFVDSKVVEFLDMCRAFQDDMKVVTFSRFVGLTEESERLSLKHFHFFFEALDCIRRLLGINWRLVVGEWEQGRANLPMACALDVVANMYNTNGPEKLAIVNETIMKLVKDAKLGPSVDLDMFLTILLKEFSASKIPVFPLFNPRRCDASQAMGNLGGNSK